MIIWKDLKEQLSPGQQTCLLWFVRLKLLLLFLACLTPFTHPHIVRQTDTMSVSMRYFSRFFIENSINHPWLPALLSAGDQYGIAPMELPVLNLLFAPVFFLPTPYSIYLCQLLFLAGILGLAYLNYRLWSRCKEDQLPLATASLVMIFFSVSSIYLNRFMPDVVAFLLVSSAMALSWNKPNWKSAPLLALGTLIKPPVVVALAMYFLKPRFYKHLNHLIWILPALSVTALYYTKGLQYISSLSDLAPYFKTGMRDPLAGLIGFLSQPKEVLDILNTSVFTKYLAIPSLLLSAIWIQRGVYKDLQLKLWGVLLLQLVGVALLDGVHSFHHHYYFVGASMTASLILLVNLRGAHRALKWVFLLVFMITSLEFSWYEVRALFKSKPTRLAQCASLKKANPSFPWGQGYRFRSPQVNPPRLGLCFGEIQGSQSSEYGFGWNKDLSRDFPANCEIVGKANEVSLIHCPIEN